MGLDDLPILGNAQIPIRLMHYSHTKDPKRYFQSGFAFFGVADDQSDVTGPNGEELGSLGGKMGGHYEIRKRGKEENITVIISVKDLWDQISNLIGSENVQIQLEGIEETYKKYWDKHEKLGEIAQMQEEAEKSQKKEEEEKRLKKAEKEVSKIKKENRKAEEEASKIRKEKLGVSSDFRKIGDWEILDDNGWDLNEETPDYDYHFPEDLRIPVDLGAGVKVVKNGISYTSKHRETPTVTLDITTWKGTGAIGAIHYYGTLKIGLPQFVQDDQARYMSSAWDIPLFKNTGINLTHVLEQWEIDRYPDNYRDQRPGYNIRGFYTPEGVKRAAQVFFAEHFDPGWEYKIEENY